MRCARFIIVALSATVITACSSAAETRSSQPSDGRVATSLDPTTDQFSFGNFTAADIIEQFDVNDLKSMYGAGTDVCMYGDAEACTPTAEAAAYARMINMARSAGHCEGLVVRAAELFSQSPDVSTSELKNSGEVTHGIIRKFATQLHGEVRREAERWSSRSLGDIVGELRAMLREGRIEYTMGLYTQSGGHTVLPYAMQSFADGIHRLSVYDPNWPGVERFVDIDLDNDVWTFSFDGNDPLRDASPWSGGRGSMDLVSLSGRQAQGCPFCGDKKSDAGTTMLIRSTDNDWNITTRNGILAAGTSSEVAGNVRPLRAGTLVRDYVVALDAQDEVTLTLKSSTKIAAMMPTAMMEIEVVDPATPVTVRLSNDGIETSGARVTVTVARGFLGARAVGDAVVLRHDGAVITGSVTSEGKTESVWSTADNKLTSPRLSDTSVRIPVELRRQSDFVARGEVPIRPPTSDAVAPAVVRAARITFDISGWSPPMDDPLSFGFETRDTIGGRANETQACRTIACLGRKVVWVARGGADVDGSSIVVSPYEFEMRGVNGPFQVRCGQRGGWVTAIRSGETYEARCLIRNVTSDAVVALRAS